jgi:hypothetical protein
MRSERLTNPKSSFIAFWLVSIWFEKLIILQTSALDRQSNWVFRIIMLKTRKTSLSFISCNICSGVEENPTMDQKTCIEIHFSTPNVVRKTNIKVFCCFFSKQHTTQINIEKLVGGGGVTLSMMEHQQEHALANEEKTASIHP